MLRRLLRVLLIWLPLSAVIIAAAMGWGWLLVKGPWHFDQPHLADLPPGPTAALVSGFRTAVVAIGAGLVALIGLVFTARTLYLNREGHVTDRYSKAVGQLGSPVIEVRMGGIFALERIMHDSPKDQRSFSFRTSCVDSAGQT
ncbi:hypothetical protein ABZ464_47805 [Streptomyces sp. NPDC005820]|uniref:hypothetical protein n=1 Tax=Streptomyces sp. NPDC005820 TaxID=3157069 RepID=UPI0033C66DDE